MRHGECRGMRVRQAQRTCYATKERMGAGVRDKDGCLASSGLQGSRPAWVGGLRQPGNAHHPTFDREGVRCLLT